MQIGCHQMPHCLSPIEVWDRTIVPCTPSILLIYAESYTLHVRLCVRAPSRSETAMEAEANTIQTNDGMSQMEFQITGLIKRKIVFNHRPTIVTHHPSPSKDLGSQRFV